MLDNQGKYGEAEVLLRRSLAINEKALGEDHPYYCASLNNLAGVLARQKKLEEAVSLLRQCLAIRERTLGVAHPHVGHTLASLAATLFEQRQVTEAEPLIERALRITEHAHGERHPDAALILDNLAGIQRALGKPDAKDTAQRALDTLVATLGADHPRVQRRGPLLCHIASGALPGGEPSGPEAALAAAILEGRAAMEAHDFARAAAHLLPVAESAHTAGNPAAEGAARSLLAQALALIGRREDAILQARRALTLAEELYDDDAVQEFGQLLAMFESGNPISEAHAPPPIPTDGPCPCGSGVPFRACHGAPDDGA